MNDLLAARLQMGASLGFQIVFACIGMITPWLMAAAQWRFLRTRDPIYRTLALAWAKGVAVFFAVGAVSGTVLSLELPGLVLVCAHAEGVPWFQRLWREPLGWGSLLMASALVPVIAHAFQRGEPWLLRCAVGGQVACVLLPGLLRLRAGTLDVAAAAAPPATLRALALAVALGLLLIVPALAYLLRVYKLSSR